MGIKLDGDVHSLQTKVLFEIRHVCAAQDDKPLAAFTSLPAAQRIAKTIYRGMQVKVVMRPINSQSRAVWQATVQRLKRWEE